MNSKEHFTKLQAWADKVCAAENSGNKTAWCRENGVNYGQYIYWQKEVRNYIAVHGEDSLSISAGSLPSVSAGSHQLVDITARVQGLSPVNRPVLNTSPAVSMTPELMLEYGDFHLYVNNNISENTLATVLKVIRNV